MSKDASDSQKSRKAAGCSKLSVVFLLMVSVACSAILTYLITKGVLSTQPRLARVKRALEPSMPGGSSPDKDIRISPAEARTQEIDSEKLRLPKDLSPQFYNLTIKSFLPGYGATIDPALNLTFEAAVTIEMSALKPTNKIVLNLKKLNISEAAVMMDKRPIKVLSMNKQKELELVTFELEEKLIPGSKIRIKIEYSGFISDSLGGMYQSHYIESDGTPRIIATTQMQPTDARAMVPCFDEPEFKANWSVAVIHPNGTRALSNSIELATISMDDEWLETTFKPTPVMSSYLLAIIISEFEFIERSTKSGIRFRVWSRPEAKKQTQYALDAGIKCIERYEEYYDIPFPLEKQDMVALPDFSAGAMENWGLVTYREEYLLYDPKIYDPRQKKNVALVVAHELAHQWFGNLVTMRWWTDLWLNEGFAAFVEHVGTDFISDGKFRMMEYFVQDNQHAGLQQDALPTSHPLSFRLEKATEVEDAFDLITYKKGSSVISMLREAVGPQHFDRGVVNYLHKFSYKNAEAHDLFEAISAQVPNDTKGADGNKLDVFEFARQWTTQMGYPVLEVRKAANRTDRVIVGQKRFRMATATPDIEKYAHPEYKFKWDVPVWYGYGNDDNATRFGWLPRDSLLVIPTHNGHAPVLNFESKGFYRVNYERELWDEIADQLYNDHNTYSINTRVRLISDAFAMAELGVLDYRTAFNVTSYMSQEKEFMPWMAFFTGLYNIANYYGTEPEIKHLRAYVRHLVKPLYEKSSIEHVSETYLSDDEFFQNQLESTIIIQMCRTRDVDCTTKMATAFRKDYLDACQGQDQSSQCSKVSVPLRRSIYCEGVSSGDRATWDRVFSAYLKERNQVEKMILLNALACSREPEILKELLSMALGWKTMSLVRLQDVDTVFRAVSSQPSGKDFIFDYILDRWDQIVTSLKSDINTLRSVVEVGTSSIRTPRQVKELETLLATSETAQRHVKRNLEEAIALGRQTVAWLSKNYENLTAYFQSNS